MSNNPKQSWAEWSDENSPAIEAAQAAPAEPCSEPTGQARALAVAPGSAAAIAAGCNCPIYDNARGKGWLCSGLYIMRYDCPIHGHRNGELSQPDGEHAGHYPSPNIQLRDADRRSL